MLELLDIECVDLQGEEGIVARDVSAQLIRVEPAQRGDYDRDVRLTVDGRTVTVPLALPHCDAQGNIVRDHDGRTTPRFTTLYDAAREAARRYPEYQNEIPILCHQEHLTPVAVCRVCMVEVRGKDRRENGLVPACQFRVKEGLDVHTIASPDAEARVRISATVGILIELLMSDHLVPDEPAATNGDPSYEPNELRRLARRFAPNGSRFAARSLPRGVDDSSAVIAVDHNACILCDRCVRACTDVKHNNVIGRNGKGYLTRIGFDLNAPMGHSSCVSCGECMITCPTDALTFRSTVDARPPDNPRGTSLLGPQPVSAAVLPREHPLFQSIPPKFLAWNAGSVWRRRIRAGDVLCEEGDYGNTAFLILRGRLGAFSGRPSPRQRESRGGWQGLLSLLGTRRSATRAAVEHQQTPVNPEFAELGLGNAVATFTSDDLIVGEMTCLNHYPRSATLVALEETEVFELRRNVVSMLERHPSSRRILNDAYRTRVLERELNRVSLFASLPPALRSRCIDFLKDRVDLVRLEPGQVVFRQGEPADHFYLVRLGFVRVNQRFQSGEWVLDYLGPGRHFGEIGLLAHVDDALASLVAAPFAGRRTATCTALDHVELVRIRGDDFHELLLRYPELHEGLRDLAARSLRENADRRKLLEQPLDSYLEQGLFLGQSLLVLDLESCTRCDECTRACADTHQGVTRLIREGLRFDKFLVASSCRSCIDPYCLVGCPVDAIHRNDTLQIRIEDHCIGCGLCARNCPYGNINMHGFRLGEDEHAGARHGLPVIRQRATTCDLCSHITTDHRQAPSCVFACPHNAAFRMTGPELRQLVESPRGT